MQQFKFQLHCIHLALVYNACFIFNPYRQFKVKIGHYFWCMHVYLVCISCIFMINVINMYDFEMKLIHAFELFHPGHFSPHNLISLTGYLYEVDTR